MNETTAAVIILLIFFFGALAYWAEPTCGSGYIPSLSFFHGWTCIPGYKP
jgi:hypothetical protein